MKQVFEVEIIRNKDSQEQQLMREYYIASHINKVIEKLSLELADQSAEVVKIHAIVPVLAVLD